VYCIAGILAYITSQTHLVRSRRGDQSRKLDAPNAVISVWFYCGTRMSSA